MNQIRESDNDRISTGWFPWNWSARVWMVSLILLLILAVFSFRAVKIFSIPLLPEPPQVASLLAEAIPEEENAFTEFKMATDLRLKILEQYQSLSIVEPDNNLVFKEGWQSADDKVISWVNDHKEALAI